MYVCLHNNVYMFVVMPVVIVKHNKIVNFIIRAIKIVFIFVVRQRVLNNQTDRLPRNQSAKQQQYLNVVIADDV